MKSYNVVISRKAIKDLDKIPAVIATKIKEKAEKVLLTDPYSCEQLKGDKFKHLRKLKHSSYRCVYEIRENELRVLLVCIGSRQSFYKILENRL